MKKIVFILILFLAGIYFISVRFNDLENLEPKKSILDKKPFQNVESLTKNGVTKTEVSDSDIEIFKLDKQRFTVQILSASYGQHVSTWSNNTTNTISINGGYFHEDYTPSGYLVVDGKRIGDKKFDEDKTGMVVIQDNKLSIRDLKVQPLKEGENFDYALQSYPFLIRNGVGAIKEDSRQEYRRSAIGLDKEDNIYLIIVNSSDLSLYEFMNELLKSDIPFIDVLNLDGGPSSGIGIHIGDYNEVIDSVFPVPNILQFHLL